MADHTFADGDVLSASDANTYLNHTGGAWNSWTPALTQLGSVTVTVSEASYWRAGRTIHFTLALIVTGVMGPTAGNNVTVSLPVTAKSGYVSSLSVFGGGRIFDTSTSTSYPGLVTFDTTTTVKFHSLSASGFLGSTTFTAQLAPDDQIVAQGTYEAASG